jgi:hypothetical protein
MRCFASAGVGFAYRVALTKRVRALSVAPKAISNALPCCILLWSGWRGFGPVRVDWLLKYRRTGGNRAGNIKRIRQEGALRGTN